MGSKGILVYDPTFLRVAGATKKEFHVSEGRKTLERPGGQRIPMEWRREYLEVSDGYKWFW